MASLFSFQGFQYLNIDATVGIDGVNNSDDVYLVQALLFEVLTNRFADRGVKPPPMPTGTFNLETRVALANYKRIRNEMAKKYPVGNPKVYYETHIDPIKGSIFAYGTNNPWAMVKLQGDILDWLVMSGSNELILDYVFKKYPQIEKACK